MTYIIALNKVPLIRLSLSETFFYQRRKKGQVFNYIGCSITKNFKTILNFLFTNSEWVRLSSRVMESFKMRIEISVGYVCLVTSRNIP